MQVSPLLRKTVTGHAHWCPACEQIHILPDRGWTFNGDVNKPTFSPSFKHSGLRCANVNGRWNGEWHRNSDGSPADGTCHYIITDGRIQFCSDSWHGRSDIVSMPLLPGPVNEHGDFGKETQD